MTKHKRPLIVSSSALINELIQAGRAEACIRDPYFSIRKADEARRNGHCVMSRKEVPTAVIKLLDQGLIRWGMWFYREKNSRLAVFPFWRKNLCDEKIAYLRNGGHEKLLYEPLDSNSLAIWLRDNTQSRNLDYHYQGSLLPEAIKTSDFWGGFYSRVMCNSINLTSGTINLRELLKDLKKEFSNHYPNHYSSL